MIPAMYKPLLENDSHILEHAKSLDLNALEALYDRYSEGIFNYMYRRLGDVETAEDLSAQVFLQMLEALQSDRAWRTAFDAWLYRIAHNLVVDYHRKHSRRARVSLDDAPPIQAADGNPVDITQRKLTREQVMRAVHELTPEQAEVVTLRFVEGLSISQVAGRMDKTEGAVKALQFRRRGLSSPSCHRSTVPPMNASSSVVEAFGQCLDALLDGRSISQCLTRHEHLRDELEPLLAVVAAAREAEFVPTWTPERRARSAIRLSRARVCSRSRSRRQEPARPRLSQGCLSSRSIETRTSDFVLVGTVTYCRHQRHPFRALA